MTLKKEKKKFWIEFLKESLIVILLLLLTVLCFWKIFTTNPKDQQSFSGDFEYQNYVFRNYSAQSLRNGEIPLWNPYSYSGGTFNSDPQTAIFYPPNLLYTFLLKDGKLKYQNAELQPIFHIFLAGLFMYIFCRSLRFTKTASLVSAVSYMFCGFLILNIGNIITQNTSVWLPMILMLLVKTFENKSFFFAVLAGLSYGISLLAGHPHMSYYVLLTMVAFTSYSIYIQTKEREDLKEIIKTLLFLGIVLITAFGVAAIQLIPTYEMVTMSARTRPYYSFAIQYSLPLTNLITFFIPMFFWGPPFWGGQWGFGEIFCYTGIIPVILALFSALYIRNRYIGFFLWLGIVPLFIAFGGNSILHGLLYIILPGFDFFRAPARFIYLSQFSIAILAGYGASLIFHSWDQELRKRVYGFYRGLRTISLIAICFGFILFLLLAHVHQDKNYGSILTIAKGYVFFLIFLLLALFIFHSRLNGFFGVSITKFILPSLIILDLLSFYWGLGWVNKKASEYWIPPEEVKFLQEKAGIQRINVDTSFKDNMGSIFKVFTINGTERPTGMKRYHEFIHLFETNPRLLDLLNVKYILTPKNLEAENATKYGIKPLKIDKGKRMVFTPDSGDVATSLEIVSWLSTAEGIPQGEVVAELKVLDSNNQIIKFPLRAGIETSECMYDRPDVIPNIKHKKAKVHSTHTGYYQGFPFNINRYIATLKFNKPVELKEIIIEYTNVGGFMEIGSLSYSGKDILNKKDRYKKIFQNIYENKYVLQRAYLVNNIRVIKDEERLLDELKTFEPEYLAILEEKPPGWSKYSISDYQMQEAGKVRFEEYTPHKIVLTVSSKEQSILVLSEIFYPGWKAFINRKETKILRTNYILRALLLEPGNHKIEFIYKPISFIMGLNITIFTFIFIMILIIFRIKKRIR